jgi:hypothetical protein
MRARFLVFFPVVSVLLFFSRPTAAREFEVVVYNVENLFDADGVSLFDDYATPGYTRGHFARKLEGASAVMQRYGEGEGPDIILFQELEADQTPEEGDSWLPNFLSRWSERTAGEWLRSDGELPAAMASAPSHLWLAKQFIDDGLPPYEIAISDYRPDPTGRDIAHVNAVFSRFPIVRVRTHHTEGARGILEATLDVGGHPLIVFVNHWKSGASNPETEPIRVGNARVLRNRLDEILRDDPHADVIIGGDFNSQYNQKQRYPQMGVTAINDVLRSQGDEYGLRQRRGPDLYNLWFELPDAQRGSDVFRDEWGTLMQMIISRGLHDFRGVQYVDNTFTVGAFEGFNAHPGTRRPVRWQFADGGFGFSDHFPISARFRTVENGDTRRWIELDRGHARAIGPSRGVPVIVAAEHIQDAASLVDAGELLRAPNLGRHFRVAGIVSQTRPFKVRVDGSGAELAVWIHDRDARTRFYSKHAEGDRLEFVAELGQFRGEWQFVLSPGGL